MSRYKGKGWDSDLAKNASREPTTSPVAARSTNDQFFVLRIFPLKKGRRCFCFFVSYWKTPFDKADHRAMQIALECLGVHRHYVELVTNLYLYEDPTFNLDARRGYDDEAATATSYMGNRP